MLAKFTTMGPVWMYMMTKLVDFIKIAWAYIWLKKERWVKNLAENKAQGNKKNEIAMPKELETWWKRHKKMRKMKQLCK